MNLNLNYIPFEDTFSNGRKGYVITCDDTAYRDHKIAKELNIDFNTYRNVITYCNAVRSGSMVHEDYMFLNEEDVIKAIVALKLITNN